MKELGAENVELADIGEQTLPDGSKIPLPPIVFGNLGADPNKKTILVYGHLDVQPASIVPHFCYMAINFFLCFIKKKTNRAMVGIASRLSWLNAMESCTVVAPQMTKDQCLIGSMPSKPIKNSSKKYPSILKWTIRAICPSFSFKLIFFPFI